LVVRLPEATFGRGTEPSVAVIGSGYVGTVVAACFSTLGRRVVGVERDDRKLAVLRTGRAPFHEGGLDDLLGGALTSRRLDFTDDVGAAVRMADVLFLCVGTPSDPDGHADLGDVERTAAAIAQVIGPRHVLVTKSTLPLGSAKRVASIVWGGVGPVPTISLVSNPEFLRQGTAVRDFLHPDRVVLGSDDAGALDVVERLYEPILNQSFPGGETSRRPSLLRTSLGIAEAVKYTANAFLATKISFINEIANICELVGADVVEVARAVGLDPRIGPAFLQSGIGWGGSCLGKDIRALMATARELGYEPSFLQAVHSLNQRQRRTVVDKLARLLAGLQGKRIALLGLAFKPGTDDLRDAPALEIASAIVDAGGGVRAYDPMVRWVAGIDGMTIVADPYQAAAHADAIVLATEWPEFLELDLAALRSCMRGDIFLDGRNLLDPGELAAAGFRAEGIGRPSRGPGTPAHGNGAFAEGLARKVATGAGGQP
jgi:nucleotide sugar dehydrogenase